MQRLSDAATAYLVLRIPRLPSGQTWSIASTLAQILLARAWLRGTASPTQSLHEQITAILSDEAKLEPDRGARSAPWQDWLNATDKHHARFRDELRSIISLTISDGAGGEGLTDVSEIAPALVRLAKNGVSDEVPVAEGDLYDDWKKASELSRLWASKARLVERTEMEQVKRRSSLIYQSLRDRSIREHLSRVDTVVNLVASSLTEASTDKVLAWKKAYDRASARFIDQADEQVERVILELEENEAAPPMSLARRLGWLALAPAKPIEDFLEAAQSGEVVIEALHEHATACISDAGGADSIEAVKTIGRSFAAIAEAQPSSARPPND